LRIPGQFLGTIIDDVPVIQRAQTVIAPNDTVRVPEPLAVRRADFTGQGVRVVALRTGVVRDRRRWTGLSGHRRCVDARPAKQTVEKRWALNSRGVIFARVHFDGTLIHPRSASYIGTIRR